MPTHPIVHLEIPANDPRTGGRFYADLFGWNVEHDETYDYTMFDATGGPGGGFTTIGAEGGVDGIVPYMDTDDIDATMAKAVSLGAAVVRAKTELPGAGYLALFKDPSGNVIGLWQGVGAA
jgi:hypothetical protein